ncbi:UNVERIFIED_CONTAM: hypothetical protein Slati_4419800 [Sesamum latifolium]|uniref:Uncharacterized protein n=1 Tax=Sesamum latifolium TaxID=2727402 RepID=A0AAW2SPT0_9LAMI
MKRRQYEVSLTHLRSEVSNLQGHLEQATLRFENYPSTEEGKKGIEELWSSRLADSKKSEDFQSLLANNVLKYYYHGYRTCAGQFIDAGYPPLTAPTNFLDINVGLADVPKPDEEVPPELPESLLHVPSEGEAPVDPEDQMEDAVPLRVVPPSQIADDTCPADNVGMGDQKSIGLVVFHSSIIIE